MYDKLDKLIIAAIAKGTHPLYDKRAGVEAAHISDVTGRDNFRVIDGRLQALRKAGRIRFLRKHECPDGKGGWRTEGELSKKDGDRKQDILLRLRFTAPGSKHADLLSDAADEIERLRELERRVAKRCSEAVPQWAPELRELLSVDSARP